MCRRQRFYVRRYGHVDEGKVRFRKMLIFLGNYYLILFYVMKSIISSNNLDHRQHNKFFEKRMSNTL